MELRLEKVGEEDRAQVEEIAGSTWEGHDYLAQVFDEWVKEEGFYCLKDENERIIALDRYAWHENGILWLEGYRVHPDYQGKGYGWRMAQEMNRIIEKLDYTALRFMTSEANEASIHIGEKLGFRPFASYYYLMIYKGEMGDTEQIDNVRQEKNISYIMQFIKSGEEFRANRGQYLAMWTAYDITENLIRKEIENGRCFSIKGENNDIRALSFFYPYEPRNTMSIAFIDGEEQGIAALLRYGMALTQRKGMKRLTLKTASERIKNIAIKNGMKESEIGKAIVWEKR